MNADQLRAIMEFLMAKVRLKDQASGGEVTIGFDVPSIDEMAAAGLDPDGCRQVLDAPWWDEMVADVVETPEMCDPDDPSEQVLQYARDVISEALRKRVQL